MVTVVTMVTIVNMVTMVNVVTVVNMVTMHGYCGYCPVTMVNMVTIHGYCTVTMHGYYSNIDAVTMLAGTQVLILHFHR